MKRSTWHRLLHLALPLAALALFLLVTVPLLMGTSLPGLIAGWWRASLLFRWVFCACVGVVAVHLLHALLVDSKIEHTRLVYHSEKLPSALDGYTAAFFSDIHIISDKRLGAAIDAVNAAKVDVALVGGDFAPPGRLKQCIELLGSLQAADGIYGVAGNHDTPGALGPLLERHGITLLQNTGVQLRDGFYLAGLEDLWTGNPQVAPAAAGAGQNDFVLLLSHNPDAAMELDMAGVDLILSGHTHGGEITLFGAFAPALLAESGYGKRFGGGWAKGREKTDIFVGRGVGRSLYLLPRVFARPQVVYVTFRR